MDLGPHVGFIVGAYIMATAVVMGLVVWVTADHVAQKRALAELERRGIGRRSAEISATANQGAGMMTLSQETARQAPQDMAQAAPPPLSPPQAGEGSEGAGRSRTGGNRRILVLLPLAVFLGLAALFLARLLGSGDASHIPSPLIGRDAPATDLPPVAGLERDGKPVPGLAASDFKGTVTVLNVWASWCVPCHDEAPLLVQLARDSRIRLVGINYKDQADNARRFLGRYGNPFAASGADTSGRAAIEWGVYGVPETFIIGRDGKIAYKLVGPVTPENIQQVIKPEIEKALTSL